MLYCKACRQVVGAGDNQCRNCGNGFVGTLICGGCGSEVPRGSPSCSRCSPSVNPHARPPSVDVLVSVGGARGGGALPNVGALSIPGLPLGLPVPVREVYSHGKFGVSAEVTMNGRDADILTKMQQTAALLNVLAAEMNNLQGHMPSTREVIKGCRKMAADIQEEVEVRLGPQG